MLKTAVGPPNLWYKIILFGEGLQVQETRYTPLDAEKEAREWAKKLWGDFREIRESWAIYFFPSGHHIKNVPDSLSIPFIKIELWDEWNRLSGDD